MSAGIGPGSSASLPARHNAAQSGPAAPSGAPGTQDTPVAGSGGSEASTGTTGGAPPGSPEALARLFHETYERLAPEHGYQTRKASAVPWEDVPAANKSLMIAVAAEVGAAHEALVRAKVAAEMRRITPASGLTDRAKVDSVAARIARGDQVTSGTGPITLHLGPTPPKQEPRRRRGGRA